MSAGWCQQADCDRPAVGDVLVTIAEFEDPSTGEVMAERSEHYRLCRIHLDVVLAAAVIRLDPPPGHRTNLHIVE